MNAKAPHAIDIYVGGRVRARRLTLGMSQTALGDRLGITFQQIQKYEKGVNRMGASRLQAAADILSVPISYFFQDNPSDQTRPEAADFDAVNAFLSTREGLSLNKAFSSIKSPDIRKTVVALVTSLAQGEEAAARQPADAPAVQASANAS
ncbi:helix-turn-helix protein [Rhizobium sp. PP-WC-2G-219]|nr:helix-turn-helix protein [Rhizobium sp. PP-WC-2G-219]